jgi:chromosome segregation ATPase
MDEADFLRSIHKQGLGIDIDKLVQEGRANSKTAGVQPEKDDLDLQFEKIQADLDETAAKIKAAEQQYGFAKPAQTTAAAKPATGFVRTNSVTSPGLNRTTSTTTTTNTAPNNNVQSAQIKQLEDKVRLAEQKAREAEDKQRVTEGKLREIESKQLNVLRQLETTAKEHETRARTAEEKLREFQGKFSQNLNTTAQMSALEKRSIEAEALAKQFEEKWRLAENKLASLSTAQSQSSSANGASATQIKQLETQLQQAQNQSRTLETRARELENQLRAAESTYRELIA